MVLVEPLKISKIVSWPVPLFFQHFTDFAKFTQSHLEEHAEHRDLSDVALPAACALLSRQPSTSMAGQGSNPPVLVRTHVLQVVRCFS